MLLLRHDNFAYYSLNSWLETIQSITSLAFSIDTSSNDMKTIPLQEKDFEKLLSHFQLQLFIFTLSFSSFHWKQTTIHRSSESFLFDSTLKFRIPSNAQCEWEHFNLVVCIQNLQQTFWLHKVQRHYCKLLNMPRMKNVSILWQILVVVYKNKNKIRLDSIENQLLIVHPFVAFAASAIVN